MTNETPDGKPLVSDKVAELHELIEENSGLRKFEGNVRAARAINAKYVVLNQEEWEQIMEMLGGDDAADSNS